MRTWTGQLSPLPSAGEAGIVCPMDLVVLLGRYNRFGNNGDNEFTVLHHSVLVSILWMVAEYPKESLIYALGHDFHEAYTGDIPAPIKNITPEVRDAMRSVEDMLDKRIYSFMGIEPPDEKTKKLVKIVDKASLIIESMITGPSGSDDIDQLKKDYPDQEIWRIVNKAMPNLKYVSASIKKKVVDREHFAYGKLADDIPISVQYQNLQSEDV
jgi:5'-deoxynucleotidase YfbR-like HD superfamily hydrolase